MENRFEADLNALISQRNYPCIAAVQALHRQELVYDTYKEFGSGQSARSLAKNLIQFKTHQQKTKTPFLTYCALYPDDTCESDEDFEHKLWRELSAIWDHADLAGEWDQHFSDNPQDKNFCFSLDGEAFFVVGMHPESRRNARRLPYPAMVFNLYSQFTDLMSKGSYDAMVATNRQRELKYQGSVNPMVLQYNETWEAIQFSGRVNDNSWECPFKKGLL